MQVDLTPLQGVAVRRAGGVNTKFILEQRAEMRARLVQYAMDNQLFFNTARLQSPQAGMWEQELEL
mgnify:FL=1